MFLLIPGGIVAGGFGWVMVQFVLRFLNGGINRLIFLGGTEGQFEKWWDVPSRS